MPQFDRLGNDMSDDIVDALAWENETDTSYENLDVAGHSRHVYMGDESAQRAPWEDDLTGHEEHLQDSQYQGDPRRCGRHPHVKTSSDDGMFDAPCHLCEGDMDNEEYYPAWLAKLAEAGPVCYVSQSVLYQMPYLRPCIPQDYLRSCHANKQDYDCYMLTNIPF